MMRIIISVIISIVLAQSISVYTYYKKTKKFDLSKFLGFGGMPSGHSATVSSLSAALFLYEGLTTLVIAVVFLSLVVLRDALKRHEFLEVGLGVLLGIIISLLVFSLWP